MTEREGTEVEGGDWRRMIADQQWADLDAYWPGATPEIGRDILEALRAIVPRVKRSNGTECAVEFAKPQELPKELKGAAQILMLGELEASCTENYLPTYLRQWSALLEEVGTACETMAERPEVTEGVPEMSRRHHASETVAFLRTVAGVVAAMLEPEDEDTPVEDDALGRALQEHVATAAVYAFAAGRHFQLALGKDHEPHALRGLKMLAGAKSSGTAISKAHAPRWEKIILAMEKAMGANRHLSVTGAAGRVYYQGLGSSAEANRKVWQRYRK